MWDGIVPEELIGHAYIFKCTFTERDVTEYTHMYNEMQEIVKNNTQHLVYELENITTSSIFKNNEVDEYMAECYKMLIAAAKVWEMVIRKKNDEEATKKWFDAYCQCAIDALNQMEDFCQTCDISEIFRSIVVGYVRENEVRFSEKRYIHAEYDEELVMYDENYYYFSEKLLKKICLPIAQTVAFTQIKKELREAGVLVCNDCKNQNFTVKIACYDKQNARIVRKRFLKIEKEAVVSEEGLTLEEIAFFKTDEEEKTEWT